MHSSQSLSRDLTIINARYQLGDIFYRSSFQMTRKKKDTGVVWSGCALLSRVAGAALHAPGWTARVVTRTLLTLYTRIPHLQDGTRRLQMRGRRLSWTQAIMLLTRSIIHKKLCKNRAKLLALFWDISLFTLVLLLQFLYKCVILYNIREIRVWNLEF